MPGSYNAGTHGNGGQVARPVCESPKPGGHERAGGGQVWELRKKENPRDRVNPVKQLLPVFVSRITGLKQGLLIFKRHSPPGRRPYGPEAALYKIAKLFYDLQESDKCVSSHGWDVKYVDPLFCSFSPMDSVKC